MRATVRPLMLAAILLTWFLCNASMQTLGDTVTFVRNDSSLVVHRNLVRKPYLTKPDLARELVNAHPVQKIQISNAVLDESAKKYIATLGAQQIILEDVNLDDGDVALILASSPCAELNVSGTDITDDAIPTLAGVPELRRLVLLNTAITVEGIGRLRSLRSDVTVVQLSSE